MVQLLRLTEHSAGRLSGILADFGLAARVPLNGEVLSQVGTPFWMAPECLAGKYYDQKVKCAGLGYKCTNIHYRFLIKYYNI